MNREIKFRGRKINSGEFVFGYYIVIDGNTKIISQNIYYAVEPDSVNQYTGFKDGEGTEIYEGDQLWICAGYSSLVVYDEKQGAFLSKYFHQEDPEDLLLCDIVDEKTRVIR